MKEYVYNRKHRGPSVVAWLVLLLLWAAAIIILIEIAKSFIATDAVADCNTPAPSAAPQLLNTASVPTMSNASFERFESTLLDLRGDEPKILIYHTHTTEAYTQTEQFSYAESSSWRTFDNERNVVAVGEALKQCLEQTYGFNVIHDITNHEPPKLSTSYERSVATIQSYLDKYPSIELVIDLHRDAYNVTDEPTTDFAMVYDNQTARIMFVVGKGVKYDDKPDFDSNYAFAQSVLSNLESIQPKLVRPIRVKDGRYNQHLSRYSLLVEMGHNANTLEQALASVPYLADAIALTCADMPQAPAVSESIVSCLVPLD